MIILHYQERHLTWKSSILVSCQESIVNNTFLSSICSRSNSIVYHHKCRCGDQLMRNKEFHQQLHHVCFENWNDFLIVPMKYQVQGNFGQSVAKTQLVHLFPKSWGCMGAAIVLWKLFLTSIADEGCPGCSSSGERMGMILAQEARCLLDIPEAFEWLMWFIAIVLFLEQTINHWQGWLNKTCWFADCPWNFNAVVWRHFFCGHQAGDRYEMQFPGCGKGDSKYSWNVLLQPLQSDFPSTKYFPHYFQENIVMEILEKVSHNLML